MLIIYVKESFKLIFRLSYYFCLSKNFYVKIISTKSQEFNKIKNKMQKSHYQFTKRIAKINQMYAFKLFKKIFKKVNFMNVLFLSQIAK